MPQDTGNAARNLATVQAIYAAFGRGDVAAILAHLAPDVRWEAWKDNHAQRANVPWLKAQTGRAAVTAFFAYIREWKTNSFAVKDLLASANAVAAEVDIDFEVTQTGARLKEEEMHLWTFDDKGQVIRFRHYSDTAKHIAAAKGLS